MMGGGTAVTSVLDYHYHLITKFGQTKMQGRAVDKFVADVTG